MKTCPACQRPNTDDVGFCAHCGAVLPAAPGQQTAPYLPPAPPATARRGRSPWFWVGLGCGLFALLTFGGCAAMLGVLRNRIVQEAQKPLSAQEVLASLQGVPIYPGAQVDIGMSKAFRAGFGLAKTLSGGKLRFEAGAFRAPAPADKVMSWYETTLRAQGWKPSAQAPRGIGSSGPALSRQRQYVKGDRQLVVQSGSAKERSGEPGGTEGADNNNSPLVLIQIVGLPLQGAE